MDFMSKVGLKMQGYTRDQVEALELVWSEVPEPIELVVTPDNYVYRDGLPVNVSIGYGENFASVDGHPVVILHPISFGQYTPDEFYNLENLDAYRDELFEATTADIRKKRLAESAEQIAAQVPQQPILPTIEECHERFCEDYLYLRTGHGRWRAKLCKCICKNPLCPHLKGKDRGNPAAQIGWRERRLIDAARFEQDSITSAMFQDLVEQVSKKDE